MTMRELLDIREDKWRPRLRSASLVAEADFRPQYTEQVVEILGRYYRKHGARVLRMWPACLVAGMAGVAATRYQGGTYWPALWDTAGFRGSESDQTDWGRAFIAALKLIGMPAFPELPLAYVGPIVMHAGIPTYCLGDYFRLLLRRRNLDPGMDAESFLAWSSAPGHEMRLAELDVPARRFLQYGGDYALDVVDRCLDLIDRLQDPDPDLDGILLPLRIIEAGRQAVQDFGLAGDRRSSGQRHGASSAQRRPRISLDPYGAGVQVVLPAVGDAPDGVATWRVVADGEPTTVRSRAQWVGSAEAAPETTHPLPRPVRTVQVSLLGWDHVSELQVIDPADPVLFFADDGRRLPGILPLPPDHVWILYPADHDLSIVGDLQVIAEMPAPFGWEGWKLQLASLEKVRSLQVSASHPHVVQGYARPRLILRPPVTGLTTPYGSPVYPDPPQLWLPGSDDSAITWHVEVRPAAGGSPLVARTFEMRGEADLWENVPRPLLGAFDVTVRGPLGRGMRRTIFIAEGVSVTYQPPIRALRPNGLEPATAVIRTPVGAHATPHRVTYGSSERGHVAEIQAGTHAEPVVVTPPHLEILCPGAGATIWTAAPVHAITEAMNDIGRLLVRTPGNSVSAELEVWAGAQRIQTIPPTGQQSDGLIGYELSRAAETVAHHGRAEMYLPWGSTAMPVAFVRPRRLATGALIEPPHLVIHDCIPVDGLAVGLYQGYAPWRPPVVLPVPGSGVVELPPELQGAGPLLAFLRVEDPWTAAAWPDWPDHGAYTCLADGAPAGQDDEESALSNFLAGTGELPGPPQQPERYWRVVHLAADLARIGAPPALRQRCAAALRTEPAAALLALMDSGLTGSEATACLIRCGFAVLRPRTPDDTQAAVRLWSATPGAAAILASEVLSGPVAEVSADLLDAAVAQCGESLTRLLDGYDDPYAQVGQFGPDAERMAVLTPEQLEAVWQAAVVVPRALLDPDTRAVAARNMFDARQSRELVAAARVAKSVVSSAQRLVALSAYSAAAREITARCHPGGKGGWLALPAMSISLALVARIAARGDVACEAFELTWRDRWTDVARRAPDLVQTDLVLAEALVSGIERTSVDEESA
ncbi:MAG: hypothetical protein ACYCO9_17805 [Streptosporangiaceae bacterium]